MIKMYSYKGCGSCRNASKWFQSKAIEVEEIAIRDQPPSVEEIEFMIEQYDGQYRKVFNVSGQAYRTMGLKDKLASMSRTEIVALLSSDGNLIKRPFVLWEGRGTVGFREPDWDAAL